MSKEDRKILELANFIDSLKNGQTDFGGRKIDFNFVPYLPQMAKPAPVSFRNCEFDINVAFSHTLPSLDFTDSIFKGRVQIHNMDFSGELLFANVDFYGEVSVNNSQFQKGCVFNNAQFHEKLNLGILKNSPELKFVGAHFHGPIELEKGSKIGALDFTGAEFHCEIQFDEVNLPTVDFTDSRFKAKVDFSKSTFNGCYFERAVFEKEVKFEQSKFWQDVSFKQAEFLADSLFNGVKSDRTEFKKSTTFQEATFRKNAIFGYCHFAKSAVFTNCHFQDAVFSEAIFGDTALFDEAHFYNATEYYNTLYHKTANYKKSSFHGIVGFNEIHAKGNIDFEEAEFNGGGTFIEAVFDKRACFKRLNVVGGFDFFSATFKSEAVFDDSDFTSRDSNRGLLSLRSSKFEGLLDMSRCTIDNLDLVGTRIQSGLFLGSNIRSDNRETYRIIKDSYEKANNRVEALHYHALEMNMLLGETKPFSKDWWILSLNKWSSNHGTDWRRGVLFTLTVALLFFSAYMFFRGSRLCFEIVCIDRFLSQYFAFIFPIRELKTEMIDLDKGGAWAMILSDLLGRIFIGFGIYQTITAFRKFRR